MGFALRSSAMLLVAAAAVAIAAPDADRLLEKTRAMVLDSARRLPRYTCVETIARAQYLPPAGSPGSCTALIARRRVDNARGGLLMRDRLRLDVAVVNGEEIFSWAGARKFETRNIDKLVGGGASGSGDFRSFLQSVFGGAPESIGYEGLRGPLAVFNFVVPPARSNYRYRSAIDGVAQTIGYRGGFSVDPADGDLKQLVVDTDDFAPGDRACSARHEMNYHRVRIGDSEFLLPEVSRMTALYRDGAESANETHYSACREYVGESTIRFDDSETPPAPPAAASKNAPAPLRPRTRLQITLSQTIDTDRSAAGDEITGFATFGRESGLVYGRIIRLAQFTVPYRWILAIRFDAIERAGVTQPLSLKPIDGTFHSPFTALPDDAGVFAFDGRGSLVLDRNFRSLWETR